MIPGRFRTAFRDEREQDSGMKVKTDSAMKSNSLRLVPESVFGSSPDFH